MKATIRLLAWAFALAVPIWGSASAQPTPTPSSGRVLVLDNERVLEGEVTRDGELYRIRRDSSELTVPANKALAVCGSVEEAYKFLSSRANLRDADEHLRLARWCLMHELRDQAIVEAATAVQMRPSHPESRQLLAMLQRPPPDVAVAPPPPLPPPASEPEPVLPVSGECLALFTTRVQPILMNTCASCHATGRGGSFNMVRISEACARKSTQHNLTAVLKQVCFDQPAASPLLFKACFAHGGAHAAPLSNQGEAVPFVTLQAWVDLVVAQHPHLRAHGAKAVPAQLPGAGIETVALKTAQDSPPAVRTLPPPEANLSNMPPPVARVVETNTGVIAANDSTPPAGQPRPLPRIEAAIVDGVDEYCAEIFNQQWHPDRR
jgi:hypothetical protein